MVLISKLALLFPGQEPILIEKIFVSEKKRQKPPIPPLTCIEREYKGSIVYIELERQCEKLAACLSGEFASVCIRKQVCV